MDKILPAPRAPFAVLGSLFYFTEPGLQTLVFVATSTTAYLHFFLADEAATIFYFQVNFIQYAFTVPSVIGFRTTGTLIAIQRLPRSKC
jgi:hypothetical protein